MLQAVTGVTAKKRVHQDVPSGISLQSLAQKIYMLLNPIDSIRNPGQGLYQTGIQGFVTAEFHLLHW